MVTVKWVETLVNCLKIPTSGHKLIENAKNVEFWRFFENLKHAIKQCYQTGQLCHKSRLKVKFSTVFLGDD